MLKGLTEDEDEFPVNDQDDLDDYLLETKEFMVIMDEEYSIKTKPAEIEKENEKDRKNSNSESNDDEKVNTNISFNMSEQEIDQIMNSVNMPEIDNINDEIEFDIDKYKEDLIRNCKNKIEDFKKDFEADTKNMISQKFNIIKNNMNKFLKEGKDNKMNNQKGKLKNQLVGKKNEFIKKQDGVNDMISEEDDDGFKKEDQLMIKFEKEEVKHDIDIKAAKFFKIENIKKNLFFVIDIDKSSKNLLFYENFTNNANYKLSPSYNNSTFYFKDPKIGENTIFIYVSEKQNGKNLSLPLKLTVKLIEDQNKNEKNKKQEEIEIKFKKNILFQRKKINKILRFFLLQKK